MEDEISRAEIRHRARHTPNKLAAKDSPSFVKKEKSEKIMKEMREIAAEQEEAVAAEITLSDATLDREMETKRKEKRICFALLLFHEVVGGRGGMGGKYA